MKVCILHFAISLLSATRISGANRLREILNIKDAPAIINPLLRQPVFPPDILNPLNKLQKRVRSYLITIGARSDVLGWVIPVDSKDTAYAELQELQKQFLAEKDALLAGYDTSCHNHLIELAQKCQGFSNADLFLETVRKAQPTISYLQAQIDFKLIKPQIIEIVDDAEKAMIQDDIFSQAIKGVAMKAQKAMESKFTTTKIHLGREAQAKFAGLVDLNPKFRPIADGLRTLLGMFEIKRNDSYSAIEQSAVEGMIVSLANHALIKTKIENGEGLFTNPLKSNPPSEPAPGEPGDDVLDPLFEPAPEAVTEADEKSAQEPIASAQSAEDGAISEDDLDDEFDFLCDDDRELPAEELQAQETAGDLDDEDQFEYAAAESNEEDEEDEGYSELDFHCDDAMEDVFSSVFVGSDEEPFREDLDESQVYPRGGLRKDSFYNW